MRVFFFVFLRRLSCSCCGGYEEYMASGTFGERLGIHSEGTFVCPKCGWHRDYVLNL